MTLGNDSLWNIIGTVGIASGALLMFSAAKPAKREAKGLPAEPPEETPAQMMARYREHD